MHSQSKLLFVSLLSCLSFTAIAGLMPSYETIHIPGHSPSEYIGYSTDTFVSINEDDSNKLTLSFSDNSLSQSQCFKHGVEFLYDNHFFAKNELLKEFYQFDSKFISRFFLETFIISKI